MYRFPKGEVGSLFLDTLLHCPPNNQGGHSRGWALKLLIYGHRKHGHWQEENWNYGHLIKAGEMAPTGDQSQAVTLIYNNFLKIFFVL